MCVLLCSCLVSAFCPERDRFLDALLKYGFGRWDTVRKEAQLPLRSDDDLRAYALGFLVQLCKLSTETSAAAKLAKSAKVSHTRGAAAAAASAAAAQGGQAGPPPPFFISLFSFQFFLACIKDDILAFTGKTAKKVGVAGGGGGGQAAAAAGAGAGAGADGSGAGSGSGAAGESQDQPINIDGDGAGAGAGAGAGGAGSGAAAEGRAHERETTVLQNKLYNCYVDQSLVPAKFTRELKGSARAHLQTLERLMALHMSVRHIEPKQKQQQQQQQAGETKTPGSGSGSGSEPLSIALTVPDMHKSKTEPCAWWRKEHDMWLLLGTYLCGDKNYDAVRTHPQLGFSKMNLLVMPTVKKKRDRSKKSTKKTVEERMADQKAAQMEQPTVDEHGNLRYKWPGVPGLSQRFRALTAALTRVVRAVQVKEAKTRLKMGLLPTSGAFAMDPSSLGLGHVASLQAPTGSITGALTRSFKQVDTWNKREKKSLYVWIYSYALGLCLCLCSLFQLLCFGLLSFYHLCALCLVLFCRLVRLRLSLPFDVVPVPVRRRGLPPGWSSVTEEPPKPLGAQYPPIGQS